MSIDLEITLEDAKLIAGLLRAAGKQKEWTTEIDKTKRESQKADAELNKFVNTIKKIDAKPTEVYRQQMDLLTKALKAGKIEQEEFDRTAKRLLQTQQQSDPFFQQQIKTERERKRASEETAAALLREAAAATKLAAALAQQQQRRADSIIEQDRTALERYKLSFAELKSLKERGLLTQEQFNRSLAREKAEFQSTDPLLKQRALALKNAEIAQQSMAKSAAANAAGSRALFTEMAGAIGLVTTATGAATVAVGLLTQAWNRAEQQAQRATDTMKDLFELTGETKQVAGPGEGAKILARADRAAAAGTADQREALTVINKSIGAGFSGEAEEMIAADKWGVNAYASAQMAERTLGIYRETDPNLTAMQTVNMALAGAREGNLSYDDIANAVSTASEASPLLGASPEATIGLLSVMGEKYGTAAKGADRITAFMSKAGTSGDARLQNKQPLDIMRTIRDEFTPEERVEYLAKDKEVNSSYAYMVQSEAAIERRTAAVGDARRKSGTDQSQVAAMERENRLIPERMATIEMLTAKNNLAVTEKQTLGLDQAGKNAALDNLDAANLQMKKNWFSRGASAGGGYVASKLGAGKAGIKIGGQLGQSGGEKALLSLLAGPAAPFVIAASLLKDAATELKKSAKRPLHAAAQIEANQPLN